MLLCSNIDHIVIGLHRSIYSNQVALEPYIHEVHININSVVFDHRRLDLRLRSILPNIDIENLFIFLLLGPSAIRIIEIL